MSRRLNGLDDTRPVRRVQRRDPGPSSEPGSGPPPGDDGWPFTIPAVAQLLRDGLDLAPGVTFLVGENGTGKSTITEALAVAAGLNAEGGTRNTRHSTRPTESPLHRSLELVRSVGAPRNGYFLRAETMHGLATYLEGIGDAGLHELSHGESFLEVIASRFRRPGFYVLDEPEAALSFTGCLALVETLADLADAGAQVLCATHSPLLTALPGATILELDEHGYAPTAWEDLALVSHWRSYLDDPQRYLRHLRPQAP